MATFDDPDEEPTEVPEERVVPDLDAIVAQRPEGESLADLTNEHRKSAKC